MFHYLRDPVHLGRTVVMICIWQLFLFDPTMTPFFVWLVITKKSYCAFLQPLKLLQCCKLISPLQLHIGLHCWENVSYCNLFAGHTWSHGHTASADNFKVIFWGFNKIIFLHNATPMKCPAKQPSFRSVKTQDCPRGEILQYTVQYGP